MEIISDLHLHSKYSRAVSQNMTLPIMAKFARQKGMRLLTTGDWTHPMWIREIKSQLQEVDQGIYSLKMDDGRLKIDENEPRFILSVEVSSIYSQGGKAHRIHCLLFVPNIEAAEKFNSALTKRGANLRSDGRPIVGIKPPELLKILMDIDERSFLIPCHVWTPWFSLYGSMSGFDSIEECFGNMSKYIYGIETGLSSDPAMNWRISELEKRSILSFSDSHSPIKMGRESTVFVTKNQELGIKNYEFTYDDIRLAIMQSPQAKFRIAYTIEFYPEEGKYHYTGHRNCKVVYSPDVTKKKGKICPVCGRGLTVGVMERVEDLAKTPEKVVENIGKSGVKWIADLNKNHPPFAKLVPLNEIIAETMHVSPASLKVIAMFENMVENIAPEFETLLKTDVSVIEKIAGKNIADAIQKVRNGNISISPGYDGEFGVVKIGPSLVRTTEGLEKIEQESLL
jgi:uncharacterized protein (TIGR00375 family)